MKGFLKYWNIATNIVVALVAVISKFAIPPRINAHILEDQTSYTQLSIFIISGILLLVLIACSYFKLKKYTRVWVILSALLLILALLSHFKYSSYYDKHTAWHEEAKASVIFGDVFIDVAQEGIDRYKQEHNGHSPSKDLIVSSFNYPDGLFTRDELERVYRNIVILYMCQVLLFCLFAFSAVQATYCLNSKK